jgi:hypothetical protein
MSANPDRVPTDAELLVRLRQRTTDADPADQEAR